MARANVTCGGMLSVPMQGPKIGNVAPMKMRMQGATADGSIGRTTRRPCMKTALITGITGQDGSYLEGVP
jgi:hypothetical protein